MWVRYFVFGFTLGFVVVTLFLRWYYSPKRLRKYRLK